jgi:hypothetical protein
MPDEDFYVRDKAWAVSQAVKEYEDNEVNIDAPDDDDFSWADDAVWVRAWVRVVYPEISDAND